MSYRILTVDDDPETTGTLKKLLERLGYVVREENAPARALQAAREFQPEVVILDYLMPEVHGGDVAWQLSSDPDLKRTKIIICSACSREEIVHKLPPAAIPIVQKPVEIGELIRLIGRSVGQTSEGKTANGR